jgi:glycosyltransferase involved in cell wall biosynthesis
VPPRITVVTPSLNQARWLPEAIASVRDQGYPDLEHLVVDGGSTDGSLEVLRASPSALRWTSGPDAGQAAALNRGFSTATGEVLGWLNADDLLLPGALARIGRAFEDPAVEAVCGWSLVVDEEGRRVGAQVHPQPTRETLLLRPRLAQETVYWRRSVLERVGPLDESLHLCLDRDYWLRMAEAGVVPRLLRRFLAAYRVHGAQKGATRRDEARAEEERILRRVHGPGATAAALRSRLPLTWRLKKRALRAALRLGLLGP